MKPSVLCLLLSLTLITSSTALGVAPLSGEQQRRVDAGEIVLLDVLPSGGDTERSRGGTAIGLVRASPATVWGILVDYHRHSGLYPRVVGAKVLEADATRALVHYAVGVGPFSFGFHVNNFPEESRGRLVWRLAHDRPNDLFHDSWGYWQVEPHARGAIVTYAMAARTVLPAFMTRGAERDGLTEALRAVRARAENGTHGSRETW
jgi:hypothetical protein